MLGFFRRRAHVSKERRDRALNAEQTRAAQAALKARVDKLVGGSGKGTTKPVSDR